jgi:hypothetical protein
MALSTGSIALRTAAKGSTSLTSASASSSAHQNNVLITSSSKAMMPRTTGGRNPSMVCTREGKGVSTRLCLGFDRVVASSRGGCGAV